MSDERLLEQYLFFYDLLEDSTDGKLNESEQAFLDRFLNRENIAGASQTG